MAVASLIVAMALTALTKGGRKHVYLPTGTDRFITTGDPGQYDANCYVLITVCIIPSPHGLLRFWISSPLHGQWVYNCLAASDSRALSLGGLPGELAYRIGCKRLI